MKIKLIKELLETTLKWLVVVVVCCLAIIGITNNTLLALLYLVIACATGWWVFTLVDIITEYHFIVSQSKMMKPMDKGKQEEIEKALQKHLNDKYKDNDKEEK